MKTRENTDPPAAAPTRLKPSLTIMAELTPWQRNVSTSSRSTTTAPVTPSTQAMETDLEPCASTASLFLFSQGSVIICLHHDSLAVERRFTRHQERITFISVDNVSERGAGRLVVSYDASQTAIVWDLFTGQEISRFASFEPLRVASWMRNGNIAFGNGKGEVILFEPSTSEHISARTIFDPITSLAPAADCRTYAIGYQNGSILIASLQPTFTILHTLTTSRGPSPIAAISWHASSSKQKSDMLATQTLDGDLRVWSVSKPPSNDSPRVIRALKRSEPYSNGPKCIAWSKNGRIVQYSDRETWIWDVRTKHVTYETIPTIEDVLGMASHGPTATLFTLGPNHTVQQYDVDSRTRVANVQLLPVSAMPLEAAAGRLRSPSPGDFIRRKDTPQNGPEFADLNSLRRATNQDLRTIEAARQQRAETASSISGRSRTNSISSRASSGRVRPFSPPLNSAYSGTNFSVTSPLGRAPSQVTSTTSIAYGSVVSSSSAGRSRGGSRLRNEVLPSPAEKPLEDLFPYTRARVNDVQYRKAQSLNDDELTSDQLRKQMLSVVFGWDDDIEALIRDELSRHPPGSQNAIFLSRWLGEHSTDQMFAMIGAGNVSATAWMFLALSQMGGQGPVNQQVGQTFVQRLLEVGDIHASATILLALGDRNDAIEVYVSRNYFMEAILMACLLMPSDWQRQSYLVRRWGEHVVSNSQQQLAIRCFMCTGAEPSEPWTSPTVPNAPASFGALNEVASPVGSPVLSSKPSISLEPPGPDPNNRMTVKSSSLKLITSFGPAHSQHFKFPGLKSDDRTPTNAPGITPIAESAVGDSALSPGGLGSYRLNNIRSINLTMNGPSGNYNRQRLPSIGETPVDVQPPTLLAPQSLPTPVDSSSDKEKLKGGSEKKKAPGSMLDSHSKNSVGDPLVLLTSARYDPNQESHDPSPQTAVQTTNAKDLPSPSAAVFESLTDYRRSRNGSRDRKPEGLHIQWPPPERPGSGSFSNPRALSVYTPTQEQSDATADSRSATSFAQSLNSAKSPVPSGRSIDEYINSLEEAQYYAKLDRHHHTRGRDKHELEVRAKQPSRPGSIDSRGRSNHRYIQPAKRSPSSPVPMSPEDFVRHNASVESIQSYVDSEKLHNRSRQGKSSSRSRNVATTERRQRSSSRGTEKKHKASSRHRSHDHSADRAFSAIRSPKSPVAMSPSGEDRPSNARSFEESLRLVTGDRERLRSRNRDRSGSRRPRERGTSMRRDASPDRRRARARSPSRQAREPGDNQTDKESIIAASVNTAGESDALSPREMLSDASYKGTSTSTQRSRLTPAERLKREQAAAELEARRLSLARRPSAPVIPLPGEVQLLKPQPEQLESPPSSGGSFTQRQGRFGGDYGSPRGRTGNPVGLPVTPRAMRYPKYSDGQPEDVEPVPDLPGSMMTSPSMTYQTEAGRIGRSMSVPMVELENDLPRDLPHHPRFNPNLPRSRSTSRTRGANGHGRKGSRDIGLNGGTSGLCGSPPIGFTIEEAPMDVVVSEANLPPILPELQHLNMPPPPPPLPSMVPPPNAAPITVGMENSRIGKEIARPYTTGATGSGEPYPVPQNREGHRMSIDHRRGRSINESLASKIRNFTGRMRSTSRGPVVRSPPIDAVEKVSPYESIPPLENRF